MMISKTEESSLLIEADELERNGSQETAAAIRRVVELNNELLGKLELMERLSSFTGGNAYGVGRSETLLRETNSAVTSTAANTYEIRESLLGGWDFEAGSILGKLQSFLDNQT